MADLPILEDLKEEEDLKYYIDFINSNLIKASFKHFSDVLILSDPLDYFNVLEQLKIFEDISLEKKKFYASKSLNILAFYEASLSQMLSNNILLEREKFALPFKKIKNIKYGENPHQRASLYSQFNNSNMELLKGKDLNLNHYLDFNLSYETLLNYNEPACVFVKHQNIISFAISDKISTAFKNAYLVDEVSSFFSICAFNRILDKDTAILLLNKKIEGICAPDYEKEALEILKKDKRIIFIKMSFINQNFAQNEFFNFSNSIIIQEKDNSDMMKNYKVLSKRLPNVEELRNLTYSALLSKNCKTYSSLIFSENKTLAFSGTQSSIYDSIKIVFEKLKYKNNNFNKNLFLSLNAPLNLKSLEIIKDFSVIGIIQPKNEIEDEEVIKFCNKKNIILISTSLRHLKH